MISLETARQLLDFGGRIGAQAAEEQLHGAVALHNILEKYRVAYLADEVGMGKTYVALGSLALFRHYDPSFRALVVAPRENIQKKWQKEWFNFVGNNVRFADLRVKALHGAPARAVVHCDSLIDLVRETALDADRDFITRLTSFSLPLGNDIEGWKAKRDALLEHLPWIDPALLSLKNKGEFKDNFARALCCALPVFDLVIVDEAHNLKGGFSKGVASRNRVLSLAFGHPNGRVEREFPNYGFRARRVLLLSATPLEDDYVQLWNQLDVFGRGGAAPELRNSRVDDEQKRESARRFLIRRVTSLQVNGERLTKNLYRREWKGGGVSTHDEPLAIPDTRQRLTVALVQKKVSELLGHERFNNSFQIGMLASFESFLETAGVAKPTEDAGISNFDDPDQTENIDERIGIDVHSINKLAKDYRKKFQAELPHPKMDALVSSLAESFTTGDKALIFVRRVASVKELQRKLEERYDEWLFDRLRRELLPQLRAALDGIIKRYREERSERRDRAARLRELHPPENGFDAEPVDSGGIETFFAWFFRGEGPPGVLSGATVQRRFSQASSLHSTFFEDNHVASLLGVDAPGVWEALLRHFDRDQDRLVDELRVRAGQQLRRVKKQPRRDVFLAYQHAAIAMLAASGGLVGERATVIQRERYSDAAVSPAGTVDAADPRDWLGSTTFWTGLRLRPELRHRLWPEAGIADFRIAFRTQELRRELFSAMSRLGNPMIDLYTLLVNRLGKIELRKREQEFEFEHDLASEFLDLLEQQLKQSDKKFTTFRELAEAASNFDLILDVNVPKLRNAPLVDAARELGRLLREQQPVGGMYGQVNETLVRQFRMPGYPLALVTTDLLQEGEDLHTFCSTVHHYGISWMPSSMEQRTGRIDRVSSQTERRLTLLRSAPAGPDLLQVYYPHLKETVEVLQVRRVLQRMDRFLRLMHRDLGTPEAERRTLDVKHEVLRRYEEIEPVKTPLLSAFPVTDEILKAPARSLAVSPEVTQGMFEQFCEFARGDLGGLAIEWEKRAPDNALMGTVKLKSRQQPFTLLLSSSQGWRIVRCVSPIGRIYSHFAAEDIEDAAQDDLVRIGAVYDARFDSYDLTVESDTTLASPGHDRARLARLVQRVVEAADRIENVLLQVDEPLATFRSDLELEPSYER